MGDVLLNGRRPLDWERAALEEGQRQELERDQQVVAGLLAEDQAALKRAPRPVTDVMWEFGR